MTRSPTIVMPLVAQYATVSLTPREAVTVPSRVTSMVTPTRSPVTRNHILSMVSLPTMKVMTPNTPTPYSVTQLHPVVFEFLSAPGTGRRAQKQSPEPV
jgi:hypothetical protein